jgi:hypothetical protein
MGSLFFTKTALGTTPGQTVSHATIGTGKHEHGRFPAQQNSTTTTTSTATMSTITWTKCLTTDDVKVIQLLDF